MLMSCKFGQPVLLRNYWKYYANNKSKNWREFANLFSPIVICKIEHKVKI